MTIDIHLLHNTVHDRTENAHSTFERIISWQCTVQHLDTIHNWNKALCLQLVQVYTHTHTYIQSSYEVRKLKHFILTWEGSSFNCFLVARNSKAAAWTNSWGKWRSFLSYQLLKSSEQCFALCMYSSKRKGSNRFVLCDHHISKSPSLHYKSLTWLFVIFIPLRVGQNGIFESVPIFTIQIRSNSN